MATSNAHQTPPPYKRTLGSLIFLSRWLQAPLYLGLIVTQVMYVYRFLLELWHLIAYAVLGHAAPESVPRQEIGGQMVVAVDSETVVMLSVLG